MWTCGYIYEQKALQALGGIESVGAALEQRGHTAVQQAHPNPNPNPNPNTNPNPRGGLSAIATRPQPRPSP